MACAGMPWRRRVSSGFIVSPTMDACGQRQRMFWINDFCVPSSPRLPPPVWCSSPTFIASGTSSATATALRPRPGAHAFERLLRGVLTALEGFVGPQITPFPVPAAVRDADVVEEAVDDLERVRPFEV